METFLEGLFEELSIARIEIDVIDFDGPSFVDQDARGWCHPSLPLYDDAGGNSALTVLDLVAELSRKPICLHQPQSDPFPKSDV